MKFKWDSAQYLQFEKERNQALLDLIMQVKQKRKANSVTSILDIGCGPANSTKMLAKHFRYAEILGIDNSQNMLNQASQRMQCQNGYILNYYVLIRSFIH